MASEHDHKSNPSTFSQDRGDFNEAMLEGKDYLKQKEALLATIQPPELETRQTVNLLDLYDLADKKVENISENKKELEPLGHFNNPDGKPQVAHDDPYL
jgi:hypothetical protein